MSHCKMIDVLLFYWNTTDVHTTPCSTVSTSIFKAVRMNFNKIFISY